MGKGGASKGGAAKGGASKGGASKGVASQGGVSNGGRQPITGPRQIGTVIEWKGAFGWIKPMTPISHPKNTKGKVYLAAEDVAMELDGVGARVSFTLYSDRNGLGAGDVRMAPGKDQQGAAAKVAPRFAQVATAGKVAATFSKGKGSVAATFAKGKGGVAAPFAKGTGKVNVAATSAKGKGTVGKAAPTFTKVAATFSKGNVGKVGATPGKGGNVATTFVKVSKFGHKVVSSTAAKFGTFASKAVAAKVPATLSKGGSSKGGSLQKTSFVQQTAFQKPRQEQFQKGGVAKGKGKGGKGAASSSAKGSGKGAKQQAQPQPTKRDIIYDKPLIGTISQWKGKFGFIKPKDTIDHPLAKKHSDGLFLAQQDVETEISGVGARVRFMLYEDERGLGAANVRAA